MCAPCLKSEGSKVLEIRNIYGSLLTLDSADSWNILSNCIGGLNYGAFLVAEDSPVVELAKKACAAHGFTPDVTLTGGGSDANFINAAAVSYTHLTLPTR